MSKKPFTPAEAEKLIKAMRAYEGIETFEAQQVLQRYIETAERVENVRRALESLLIYGPVDGTPEARARHVTQFLMTLGGAIGSYGAFDDIAEKVEAAVLATSAEEGAALVRGDAMTPEEIAALDAEKKEAT